MMKKSKSLRSADLTTGICIYASGAALNAVLPHTVRQFARAIIMPNFKPPVRSVADAAAYRARILAAIPTGKRFEPLMTLLM